MEINAGMNNGYYTPQMDYGNPYMQQNPYFQQQPMTMNPQMQVPQYQNALTNEEIQRLRSLRPTSNLNLSIDQEEVLRAMCTHKDNGREMVQLIQDGSGDAYCPICGKRWKPEQLPQEDVQALVDQLIAQMQNAKWVGEFPANVVREFFAMMPLIEKFPEIYKYAMRNFNKYAGQSAMYNAADANIYAMYNGLFTGGGYGYNNYYGNPYMQGGYYQQNPQQGYYQQATPQANPNINPMQQPVYGAPGYNPQFGNQANMMMGGTYYQQQQPVGSPFMNAPQQGAPVPGQPYTPEFRTPAPQQTAPATDASKPVAPASDTKADL